MLQSDDFKSLFDQANWHASGRGPRYMQLYRHMASLITSGRLEALSQLPTERELTDMTGVSRVTIRKAVSQLVTDNLIEQRRGAGTFVKAQNSKLDYSLTSLASFTENLLARGMNSTSQVLSHGIFAPSPDEFSALGIPTNEQVSRVSRLRSADGVIMALESSSLPTDILPNPEKVTTSLYQLLRASGSAPTRAIQRINAINLTARDAEILKMSEGAAVLSIDRTAYLSTGRPIEFTRGLYRSDIYDFASDLRLETT